MRTTRQRDDPTLSIKPGAPSTTSMWQHNHMLDLDDFTQREIELILHTTDAMKEVGCLYLAQVGGASALYTSRVEGIEKVYWEDMGPERIVSFKLKDFGPLNVGMDAHGNSIYEKVAAETQRRLPEIYRMLTIKR